MGRDAAVTRWVRKALAALAACALALGLVPAPALADDASAAAATEESGLQLEAGAYVEHEALALVVNDAAAPLARSSASDALSGAEDLMGVSAEAVCETLGDDAGLTAQARSGVAALAASAVSDDGADAAAEADAAASDARIVLVRDESKTTEELIAELEADPRVAFAEPNYYVESADDTADIPVDSSDLGDFAPTLDAEDPAASGSGADAEDPAASGRGSDSDAEGSGAPVADASEPAASDADASTGSDSDSDSEADAGASESDMTAFQWGMSNDGTMGGVAAEDAVDIGYGAWEEAAASGDWQTAAQEANASLEDVVVAVIDSGVDETNPDLDGVLWSDGEQYPQLTALGGDEHGISLVPGTTSTSPIGSDEAHGTHVAGIIAAEWDGQGTSGVAPNVQIMSVRSEVSSASEMLACINYVTEAARAGVNVRVANCSWGMGANASRAFDVALTQLGREGVTAVFASGNADSDMDATTGTVSTLRDNPYVVVADSVDASGALSMYSCYGQATTDVAAPGSTILSASPTSDPRYLGEVDEDAALYESFDDATRVDAQTGLAGGEQLLDFSYVIVGGSAEVASDGMRFEGTSALELQYRYDVASALAQTELFQNLGMPDCMAVQSDAINLSALSEKPRYLSLRAISYGAEGTECSPVVTVGVRTDGGGIALLDEKGSFGLGGDTWSGQYVELPENTDWANFQIVIFYVNTQASILGGQQSRYPMDGTVLIDSIGLGSDLVPYKYDQGTSMAAPAVSGAAAVLAGANPDDSAAQLAARVKGAAQGGAYDDYCSTGGYATVDGGGSPAPTPVEASASEDGSTVTVRGYFVPDGVSVSIGEEECAVIARDDAAGGAGDDELVELTVRAPEGFAGGEQWVELSSGGARGRVLVEFGAVSQGGGSSGDEAAYYDEASLPVPAELDDWSGWQLAGFAGDVYALPRSGAFNTDADYAFMLKYDPDLREWDRVALPSDEQLAAVGADNVASMAAATFQGSLIVQITSLNYTEGGDSYPVGSYWRYTAEGVWEHLEMTLPDGVLLGLSALGSDGENVYVFGGVGTYEHDVEGGAGTGEVRAILRLDLEDGTAEQVGEMIRPRFGSTQVAYLDGAFLVGGGQNMAAQDGTSMGVERVRVFREAQTAQSATGEMVEYPAGSLSSIPVRMSTLVTETGQLAFAPAAVADGFMIVGPRSDSGDADTYTVANEDSALPGTYDKLASSKQLLSPSALAYNGRLYVLAATTSAPYRVFSATAVDTVAQPGDYVAPDDGGDSGAIDGDDASGSLKPLASTGDPLGQLAIAASLAALAGVAGVAGARVRSRRG